MKIKFIRPACYDDGKGNISCDEDFRLTKKRVEDFCRGKNVVNIFFIDTYNCFCIVYKEGKKR